MIGYHALVARLRDRVPETTVDELRARMDDPPVLIDIREADEVVSGFIPGAVHVPRGVLESAVERLDRSAEIVLYCSGGNRSILAAASLQDMGFDRVSSLAGGTAHWRLSGLPISVPGAPDRESDEPAPLPGPAERARYARQLALPEVGPGGQRRLASSSVLVVGAGGLGSPAATYLAAAGVGRIALADPDVVDVTNLQRQFLHGTTTVGALKVESAARRLRDLNPEVLVEPHAKALNAANALDMLAGHDVIVDGSDNFPTRYLLNDAVLHTGTPLVHGSVFRFEGQVAVFTPGTGPCYRCLFPQPPPPHLAPDCATAGVMGSVTGIVGSIQATEALKVLLGIGKSLSGRLLMVDALAHRWETLEFERDPACPACGPDGPPPLTDYDDTCI